MVNQSQSSVVAATPQRRVILLGASNLTRGIATVVDACQCIWGSPLEIFAALGHGRSYGTRSTVLGRSLPSILNGDLWPALAERDRVPTAALITDIGNDLLYEQPVERIVDWVSGCLDLLAQHEARVVMTRLPIANIDSLPEWKFRLLRRAMFPLGTAPFQVIAERARELDRRLIEVAGERRVTLVEQQRAWYGWDPIHLKSSAWPKAWHEVLSAWTDSPPERVTRNPGLSQMLYLRTRRPQQRWWFGMEQRGPQPSGRLPGGSVVSFY
jgi:hypothetical protein